MLVSSIKDSTPNLDDGKASSKEEYDSSVSANTDATTKDKMSENGSGSATPKLIRICIFNYWSAN